MAQAGRFVVELDLIAYSAVSRTLLVARAEVTSRVIMSERENLWRDFEAMAKRPLSERIRYGFIWTYKPVLDDAPYRSFETMEDYRQWCEANLPKWLGFARV